MKYRLSDSAQRLEGQPMFKLLGKVKELERMGENIIHFEIGDPDFSTPNNIVDAAVKSLQNGETHYTSSMGLRDFREVVCETTLKTRGFTPEIDQVLIAPGANIIIYYAVSCLVNQGDEVIVPDPGFPTYYSAIKYCDAVPIRVPLYEKNNFRMNPEDVKKKITDKTRLIIINSPQNPTGSVMTPEEINQMANIAEEHDIYLYSDEVYVRMMYGDMPFASPSTKDHCKKRTILANGFSKAFAMTGWRLGVAVGPLDVIQKMGLLLETLSSCVPPFVQRAGIEAVIGDQTITKKMIKEYHERRDIMVNGLNSLPGISCVKPDGAFYVFPNITKTGLKSDQFAELMLTKAKVALLPGTNFGEHAEGYVRLCYANSKENIKIGLERMREILKKL